MNMERRHRTTQGATVLYAKKPTRSVNELVALPYVQAYTNPDHMSAETNVNVNRRVRFLLMALTLVMSLVWILVTKRVVVQRMLNS